jgi:hypothetical protein
MLRVLTAAVVFTLGCTVGAFKTKFSFEHEVGANPPLGYFDPLGILKNATPETFERLRYVRAVLV